MNNTLIFLRHAETKRDPAIPVKEWNLTENGKKMAEDLAAKEIFHNVDIIISSTETKAYETAKIFGRRINKKIIMAPQINEINGDVQELINKNAKEDSEIARDLNIFKEFIKELEEKHQNKKILIVGHGAIMTLYFSSLQNRMKDFLKNWQDLSFCAYGIVKNQAVVKDIL